MNPKSTTPNLDKVLDAQRTKTALSLTEEEVESAKKELTKLKHDLKITKEHLDYATVAGGMSN